MKYYSENYLSTPEKRQASSYFDVREKKSPALIFPSFHDRLLVPYNSDLKYFSTELFISTSYYYIALLRREINE